LLPPYYCSKSLRALSGVTAATLEYLQQAAETALLSRCIIRIPADLSYRQLPKYKIPPVLKGKEMHVKHLVIDLNVFTQEKSQGLSTSTHKQQSKPLLTHDWFSRSTSFRMYLV
jgi:hypothetical protein